MAQAINTFYTIAKVPMRLYYDSDRAAKRIATQAGWVQEAGNYRVVNVMWTNANGDWLQTEPTSGGIALYAIRNITDSYIIGWVRDDDNVKKGEITSIPSTITTEDASFKVGFTKMPGSTYTLKMVSNGVTWGSYVNSDNSIAWDNLSQTHVFNAVNKAKIYSAMPSSTNASATVTLETTYQGKSLGTDTKTIQVSIPNSIKPSFASTPVATITGAVGGKNYVGLTSLKLVVPTITIPSGATITSTIIDIGGQRSGNLAVGGSLTRAFNTAGTVSASVTTTDSRGRSAVYSTSYAVLAHQSISIDSFTAIRNGATGIKITANGRYMAVVDGTPKYTITKSIRGANTWTSVATGTATVANGRYTIAVTQTSGFTASSAYDLRIVVSGTRTSATGNSVVGTEAVPMSFGKHGSGVGTMFDNSNSASLQVGSGGIHSEGALIGKNLTIQSDGGNVQSLNTLYHASSGLLIDICGHHTYNMITVYVKGNGYSGIPINSMFQTYHYNSIGNFLETKQINFGYTLPTGVFFVHGTRIKLWIPPAATYQTYTVTATGMHGAIYKVGLSNSAFPGSITYRSNCQVYKSWNQMNHGAGSGLSADLLDGLHASDFALASHATTYGTHTNGKYWRSGNMQTCTGKVTLSSGGNGYYYAGTWTFPASFYSDSEIYCSANVSTVPTADNYMNWNGNATMHSATTTGVSMWWAGTHDTKALSGTVTLDVIAIGRWKA